MEVLGVSRRTAAIQHTECGQFLGREIAEAFFCPTSRYAADALGRTRLQHVHRSRLLAEIQRREMTRGMLQVTIHLKAEEEKLES